MGQQKTFTRKNYGTLYKWSVRTGLQGKSKINLGKGKNASSGNVGCTATVGSQGQDWITGYVYNVILVNGVIQRLGYVACGYAT